MEVLVLKDNTHTHTHTTRGPSHTNIHIHTHIETHTPPGASHSTYHTHQTPPSVRGGAKSVLKRMPYYKTYTTQTL